MILYQFPTSPFARRVRLALAHKGLSAELRDARASAEHREEANRLNPLKTVPVLVDGERVVVDSNAICEYLDRKQPDPPLWPAGLDGAAAHELVVLVDGVVTILADLGTRFWPLHGDPAFGAVRAEMIGRAQRALDALSACAGGRSGPLFGGAWSGGDIALFAAVVWLEGLPQRAATFAPAKQIAELGWSLPPALSAWADQHRQRPDVLSLG